MARYAVVLCYAVSEQVYTERDEGFDKKLVDGAVDEEEGGAGNDEAAAAAARTERLYAIRAHLEHEFDAVRKEYLSSPTSNQSATCSSTFYNSNIYMLRSSNSSSRSRSRSRSSGSSRSRSSSSSQ